MTECERVRRVVGWLIYMGYGRSEKDIAEKLGYTKSSFSQIINGRVPLSKRFVERLSSMDNNINKVWILTGEGIMLKNNHAEDTSFSAAADITMRYGKERMSTGYLSGPNLLGEIEMRSLLDILREKDRQIETLQMQISDLIRLLKS